jgi:hypothetical protein
MRRSALIWTTAGVAGIAAVLLIFAIAPIRGWYETYTAKRGMATLALVSTQLPDRPFEARLTGGFAYRPLQEPVRGRGDVSHEMVTVRILAIVAKNENQGPSFGRLHTAGAGRLLLGDTAAATLLLEQAVKTETGRRSVLEGASASRNSALLTDLAAAYYERYMRNREISDLQRSIDTSERSWRIRETPEAAWNRAVALEAAKSTRAKSAWVDYLKIDSSTLWASEATHHLERLRTSVNR